MILFKVCPKCQGDVCLKEDIFGKFLSCLQCGYLKDVELAYKRPRERPDVRIDQEYKAA